MSSAESRFGSLLRRYRAAARLTQEELAERSGLSVRGISDLERGAREHPHRDTVEMLARALDLGEPERAALFEAGRAGGRTPSRHDIPGRLPVPLTSLIGREDDCRRIQGLLQGDEVRLLNLIGPGGVGKTRLAIRCAADLEASFPDGVRYVSLAPLRDPELVAATIVHGLGLQESSGISPLDRLRDYLRERRLLLVLDNFEHLLAAAPILNDLLASCPGVKVLTTSRVLLRLSSERVYEVSPLAVPDQDEAIEVARLSLVPATALFIERRSRAGPGSALSEVDAAAVAKICGLLDGLPLAIELAAARSRHLPLPELASRLQRRLPLLNEGSLDLPARQQTLRAAIGWSYTLLAPDAQALFRRLAVFTGGWTLSSAESLAAGLTGPPVEIGDVISALGSLVDGSLVRLEAGGGRRSRYRMLATIREFAEEALIAYGEEDETRRRQAEVMLDFTEQAERGLESGERSDWAAASIDELDNVRAALDWSLDHDEAERALRMVGNLDWFWDAVARDREGLSWCDRVLVRPELDRSSLSYARALGTAGAIAWNTGDFARSASLLSESVDRLRRLDDPRSLGQSLANLGLTRLYLGDVEGARECLSESLDLYQTIDDPWGLAMAHYGLAEILVRSDLEAAESSYQQSHALFRSIEEPWGTALAIAGLAGVAMRRRDYATARRQLLASLELRRSIGNLGSIAISLTSLGELARREGDLAEAKRYLADGLAHCRDFGDAEHIAWNLYNTGLVATRQGDIEAAARAFEECLRLRVSQGNPVEIANTVSGIAGLATVMREFALAADLWDSVEAARHEHDAAPPSEEDAEAERAMSQAIRQGLGKTVASDRLAAGRAVSLMEAVRQAGAFVAEIGKAAPAGDQVDG